MLCQLSYRGSAAAIVARRLRRTRGWLVADLRELLLELDEVRRLRRSESSPLEPALAQAQEQLLGRLLGDARPRRPARRARRGAASARRRPAPARAGARARAGAARRRSARGRAPRASATSFGCAATPASALRSSRWPGVEQARRDRRRRRASCRARARAPPASPAAGRAGRSRAAARRDAPASRAATLRNAWIAANAALLVARALVQQPHAVHRIADRRARAAARTRPGSSAGSVPFGSDDDLHVEALRAPRAPSRAASRPGPAASESKQRKSRFVSRFELAQLRLGQRRAHRRDDRLEPRLPQREHVGVPLDDDARGPASRSPAARCRARRGGRPS